MPSHFTSRMQFGLHQDPEEIREQLLALVREAPIDEVAVFFFAEELNDGHDTLERITQWIEHSRVYRQALEAAGVAVSLNPWHSVLHTDRGRTLKPGQDWQTMVGFDGRECTAVVCPLDEGWQAYYDEVLRRCARENFRVIWVDDDIRFHNHGKLTWGGCFCPLHVAEFNRRAGTQATRDEIVAACLAPGEPHPWRALWMDMWQDNHLAMITRWREIVEADGCLLGLMSSSMEGHTSEGRRWADWWKAFGGDAHPPVHRPHFWGYSDVPGWLLSNSMAALDQNRGIQPDAVESGPEIENFPYGQWNKSYRQTFAQMSLAHILGSTNLNISLYDFMGNRPDDEPSRADFLRRMHPLMDWLADEFPMSLRTVGVGVPWEEDMSRLVHTEPGENWTTGFCFATRAWANWLGAAGHAFTMRAAPAVNAISGRNAWSFSDAQLRAWLSRGVLLDGLAAQILIERGYGEWIGLRGGRFITQDDVPFAIERTTDAAFGLHTEAQITVNDKAYCQELFQGDLCDGARVVSELRGPTYELVGHGLTVFENAQGGRVATVPWSAAVAVLMNVQRWAQLTKTLAWLDPTGQHGSVDGSAWLMPQFLTDGARWRGVIWNAGPDDVEEFAVTLPAAMPAPREVIQVTARGARMPALMAGGRIRLSQPLDQWEYVVLL